MISTGELDHSFRLDEDEDSSPEQDDTNYNEDDRELTLESDTEILLEELPTKKEPEDQEQQHGVNVSIVQATNPPQTDTLAPQEPPCSCSHSTALANLAALSNGLSAHERWRLESGLLRFAEDFM